MITLNAQEVIMLHEKLIAATGGSSGLRDEGLLESAVLGCYQSFDDAELYPTIIEKAARMAYSLCMNHPFIDGNKRVAVTTMLVLLRLNKIALSYSQDELVALGLGIAENNIDFEGIVSWISCHLVDV